VCKCGNLPRESWKNAVKSTGAVYMLDCMYVCIFAHSGAICIYDFMHVCICCNLPREWWTSALINAGAVYMLICIRAYTLVHMGAVCTLYFILRV